MSEHIFEIGVNDAPASQRERVRIVILAPSQGIVLTRYFNYARTDVSAYNGAHASKYRGKILPHPRVTSV